MLIPGLVEDFDEANPALDEATSQEAGARVVRFARLDPVEIKNVFWFLRKIHEIGRAGLHAIGHFERVDACGDLGVTDQIQMLSIESLNGVERAALERTIHSGRIRKVEDRIAGAAEKSS